MQASQEFHGMDGVGGGVSQVDEGGWWRDEWLKLGKCMPLDQLPNLFVSQFLVWWTIPTKL